MIKLIPYIISSYYFKQFVSELLLKYYRRTVLLLIIQYRM
jgi:hypothetical protein